MKKLMSAIIAAALSVSVLVPVFAADTFKDVNSKSYSWAYDFVEDMAECGLIKGYEDGTFRPGNSVSRMDAFAFFSRLMGSNSEVNADILAQAKEKYAGVLAKYGLSYAEGDIAYMLSRGVLTESELDTYFGGTKKTEPMPRYEAAILITKAMLGEQDAKNEVLVDMDYTDVSSIPKNAKQYVYYVTQKKIMQGMGENEFSPNTDVLRGQMAVMLSNTFAATEYAFESATISNIDQSSKNITAKDAGGQSFTIAYNSDSRFAMNGEVIAVSKLSSGHKAVFTYVSEGSGKKLAFADVIGKSIDMTKSVIFNGYTSNSGTLMIAVTNPSDGSVESYVLSGSADIMADGKATDINSIKPGDYVTLGLSNDEVLSIDAMQKSTKIEAVIEKVGVLGTITISCPGNEEFDGITLTLSPSAAIYKNNDTSSFSELGRGDNVVITLEYGIVTKVTATSATKTITGVLKSYTISAEAPSVTINRDGKDYTFDVPGTADITLNGEKAALTSFKIGNTITVTVESEVVKRITASGTATVSGSEEITGTVVGAVDKTIVVQNSDNGGDIQIIVSVTSSTKIVLQTLSEYSIKNIKAGDFLRIYGSYSNGIFVATTITVIPAAR